ncbi:MAG: hypothetical protein M1814_001746 [Vezdaea aestivalis]|nr:MAG: hypothetical protein M1814_001746 [Vezdaea aestivalis]
MAYPRGAERWDSDRFEYERSRADRGSLGGRRVEIERDRIDDYRGSAGGRRYEDDREEVDFVDERSAYGGSRRGEPVTRREIEVDYSRDRGGRPPRRAATHYDLDRGSPSPSRSTVTTGSRRDSRHQSIAIELDRREVDRRGPPPAGRPARPGYVRRQSSLDTFDRRRPQRYDEEEEEEIDIHASFGGRRDDHPPHREEFRPPPRQAYRPPPNVPIPLPRPRHSSPNRYEEREYEEIRIAEPDYYGDEGYHEYHRQKHHPRQQSRSRIEIKETSDTIEVEERERGRHFPRRGRTKVPRKLVDIRAAIQMGFPFEEEADSITILLALGGEQIDEMVRISDHMRREGGGKTETIRIEETTRLIEPPPPPPPAPQTEIFETRSTFREEFSSPPPPGPYPPPPFPHQHMAPPFPPQFSPGPPQPQIIQAPPAPPPQIITLPAQEPLPPRTEYIRGGPPSHHHHDNWAIKTGAKSDHNDRDTEVIAITDSKVRRSRSHRRKSRSHSSSSSSSSASPRRELVVEEKSNRIGGPLSIFDPDRRKSDRDLKDEIRALDREKRDLKRERRDRSSSRSRHHNRRSKSERRAKSVRRRRRSGFEADVEEIEVKRDRRGKMELVAR